jgi:hypothetical protein
MNNSCPKRETMSIEEATVSNMWDIAALVEVLERKGHCTKEYLYNINMEFLCFYRVKKYTAPAGEPSCQPDCHRSRSHELVHPGASRRSTTEIPDDIMQQSLTLVARSTDGNIQPFDDGMQAACRDDLTICTAGRR